MSQLLPQRVTDVRDDGGQYQSCRLQRLLANRAALGRFVREPADGIQKLHHRGDRGVEITAPADVVSCLLQSLMRCPAQLALLR